MNAQLLSDTIVASGKTAAMNRISKARSVMVIRQPFWGTLSLYLQLVEKDEVQTMATDGVNLYFNSEFVLSLPWDHLIGVIAHEVSHCAYRHHARRGRREIGMWNDACDYVINSLLLGFSLPADALVDHSLEYHGLGAEEVYARLKAKRDAKAKAEGQGQSGSSGNSGGQSAQPGSSGSAPNQSGEPQPGSSGDDAGAGSSPGHPTIPAGNGSPASGSPTPGQQPSGSCPWGGVEEPVAGHEVPSLASNAAEWAVRVKQATAVARRKYAGTLPGDIERLAEEVAKPAKIDWREHMRQFINDKTQVNYSWVHPNKRFPHTILPGTVTDSVAKIGVCVDVSGSIDQVALNAMGRELQDLMDSGEVAEVVVIYCDTEVRRVEQYCAGETIKLKATGGGGTAFSPALRWFSDNEPDASAIVYFTDLECDDYGTEPFIPVLWMAYGFESNVSRLSKKVPFGDVVHLEP